MPRFLVALVALALVIIAAPGAVPSAAAGKGRPVHIDSEPPGAEVYLGDKEQGSVGQTPLDLELAPGEYVVIVELDGHVPAFETLIVEDLKGPKASLTTRLVVSLAAGKAMLEVKGSAPPDARVLVDGKDRGALPIRIEVDAGAHQVQVTMAGREPFEQWIELEGGQQHEVTVSLDDLPEAPPPPAGPKGPRPPLAIVRLGSKVIWRRFDYAGVPDDLYTAPFASDARPMVRAEAEVAPWRTSKPAWRIWPLTLVVAAGITPTDTATRATETANYNQRELEAGVRYRLGLGARAAIAFDVGWAALLYNFRGDLAYALPDVDYHALRIGVRGEGALGPVTGWAGIENRLVAGGGDLEGRFKAANADGFAARLGASARLWRGRLEIGAEYALVRYAWTFEPRDNNPMYVAAEGTDTFHNLGLWLGGAY
ncbi:MAG TPA: PEGA domain-containing protein [Kofleriaceae bacterium]|nr:PEGA domain-containing protein [Kofleriaceae bacterium]